MLSKPLRMLSILRAQWDEQRFPALQALADMGHHVVYVDEILEISDYWKLLKKVQFDVAVLWGNSLQNLLLSTDQAFFLDEIGLPYVSMWTDNPTKHLSVLERVSEKNHRAMFVPDSKVLEQLSSIGYGNVFYLPPWHID